MGNCSSFNIDISEWQFVRYEGVHLRIWCPTPEVARTTDCPSTAIDDRIGRSRLAKINKLLNGELNKAISVINVVRKYVDPLAPPKTALQRFFVYSRCRQSICLAMLNSMLRVFDQPRHLESLLLTFTSRLQIQRKKRPSQSFVFDSASGTYRRNYPILSQILDRYWPKFASVHYNKPSFPTGRSRFRKCILTSPRGYARE